MKSMKRPDVVFLHAFPLNHRMWDGQVHRLNGAGFRVLAPDVPGFGGRALVGGSLSRYAREILAGLDDMGVDRAVFVGLSMGGYLAFRVYEQAPQRVLGLVLADTKAGADPEEMRGIRTTQAERARSEGIGWLADEMVPRLLGETTRRDRPTVVEGVRDLIQEADPEGVATALEAMRDRPDSGSLLRRIQSPVLVLVGEEDGLTPPDEARRMAEALPCTRLAVIPGAGHLSSMENPAAFDESLLAFLEGFR